MYVRLEGNKLCKSRGGKCAPRLKIYENLVKRRFLTIFSFSLVGAKLTAIFGIANGRQNVATHGPERSVDLRANIDEESSQPR